MHRHTDISADGAGDGTLWDAYRYMMDAADMDYFLLTDHQSGDAGIHLVAHREIEPTCSTCRARSRRSTEPSAA